MGAAAEAAPVGVATEALADSVGYNAAARYALRPGSAVELNDTIETDAVGRARIQLFDQTLLSIGPQSRVKVDRYVAAQDGRASKVVVNALRGAFRFASGISGSRSYSIVTPVATIGVRGTRFDFSMQNRILRVAVTQGAVIVCETGGRNCRQARAGETITFSNRKFSVVKGLTNLGGLAPALGVALANIGGIAASELNSITSVQQALPGRSDGLPIGGVAPLGGLGGAGDLFGGGGPGGGAVGRGLNGGGLNGGGLGGSVGGIGGVLRR